MSHFVKSNVKMFFAHERFDENDLLDYIQGVHIDKSILQMRERTLEYSGLNNMGCTCYLNSVLQQLYALKPFVQQFLNTPQDKPGITELQDLFTFMGNSIVKSADASSFVTNFQWNKQSIDPREQQDANEFFMYLINSISKESSKLFKGSLRHIIRGETEDYETYNNEEFFSIGLETKNIDKIEKSFDLFCEADRFEDHFAEKLGKKINILKSAKIEEAPPVLVFHLKRFEYSLETGQRYKVNSRFEFTDTVDISPMMLNSSDPCIYKLHGIVMHHGSAERGHYTSYINEKFQNWFLFDDSEVTSVEEKTILNYAFGAGGSQDGSSAYLLFYVREGENIEININYNEEKLKFIRNWNDEYKKMQSDASHDFMKFVLENCSNPIPYFCNIYSKAYLSSYSDEMQTALNNFFTNNPNALDILNDLFFNNFPVIFEIYKTSKDDILAKAKDITLKTIDALGVENATNLISKFLDEIPALILNYSQLPAIFDVFLHFAEFYHEIIPMEQVYNAALQIIATIYGEERNSVFLSNINISSLLKVLLFAEDFDFSSLLQFDSLIFQSYSSVETFVELILKLSTQEKIDIRNYLQLMVSSKMNSVVEKGLQIMIDVILNTFESLDQYIEITANQNCLDKFLLFMLLRLRNMDTRVYDIFIQNPDKLISLLINPNSDVRATAEKIIVDMFPYYKLPPIMKPYQFKYGIVSEYIGDSEHNEDRVLENDFATLEMILSVINAKMKEFLENPQQFYSTASNPDFYAVNLINCYAYLIGPLGYIDREHFDFLFQLSERLEQLKIVEDKNLDQVLHCMLDVMTPEDPEIRSILMKKISQNRRRVESAPDQLIELVNNLKMASQEEVAAFYESEMAVEVLMSFTTAETENMNSIIFEIGSMAYRIMTTASMQFLTNLYEYPSMNTFSYICPPISALFRICHYHLNDNAVIRFAYQVIKILTHNSAYSNIYDGLLGLVDDPRWIGQFRLNLKPLLNKLIEAPIEACSMIVNLILAILPYKRRTNALIEKIPLIFQECRADFNRCAVLAIYMECCFLSNISFSLQDFLEQIRDISPIFHYLMPKLVEMTNNMWQIELFEFIISNYPPNKIFVNFLMKLSRIPNIMPANLPEEWVAALAPPKPPVYNFQYFDPRTNSIVSEDENYQTPIEIID